MAEIDYKAVLADLIARRDEYNAAIAAVKRILGESPNGVEPTSMLPLPTGDSVYIPSDAFFGLGVVEAAKKYLSIAKRKQTARQIAEALEKGGVTHASSNFYNTVYALLRRQAKDGDIVKLPHGEWGLADWYPGIKSKRSKAAKSDEETSESEADPSKLATADEDVPF